MRKISQLPWMQRLGIRLGHLSKRFFRALLDAVVPVPANIAQQDMRDVRRVLVVRPNFRIGNTLITSPLVLALRQRFPGATIDWLAGDTTASLLANLPLNQVFTISRRFIARPWQFVGLFVGLRRARYDVAIEAGMGSFSGGLYAILAGARYRVGCAGKGDRFLNVRLPQVATAHVYDSPAAFARLLGVECPDHPIYVVSSEERQRAEAVLASLGLVQDGAVVPFAAVFVGGHQDKRWPAPQWLDMVRALAEAGGRMAVFLGPEEMHFAERMRDGLAGLAGVVPPQPLRIFAALWSSAALIVTPDSGPMHLAAALQVPAVAILQSDNSRSYAPRGAGDVVLMRPSVDDAVGAVMAHPLWPAVAVSPLPARGVGPTR